MDDVRDRLAHVLWLGGSPRAGKTTLSRLLAGKYDLKIYNLDWHYWREHQEHLDARRHPISLRWRDASAEEWWVRPSREEIVERAIALWTETFEFVVDDLLALPRSRIVLAEGAGAFPWLVAPLLSSPHQAAFLVATASFRDATLELKLAGEQFGANTSDSALAQANHRAHDLALTERVVTGCMDLGLRSVEMDASHDFSASLATVEERFRPLLPSTLNV